jgi:hypothetical protein
MTDYTNTYGGLAKDSGTDIILGEDLDTEFDKAAIASATKANKVAGATLNNIIVMDATGDAKDSGVLYTEIAAKANLVASPTDDNIILSDAGGDTKDSGRSITTVAKTKILQITNWNMTSTSVKNVAHGLTQSTIRGVQVLLEDDPGTFLVEFTGGYGTNHSGGITVTSTNITMTRGQTSDFNNSTDYDGTGDRGWITITYV